RTLLGMDADIHRIYGIAGIAPLHFDGTFWLAHDQCLVRGAVTAVNRHTSALGDITTDRVGRRRAAAARQLCQQRIDSDHQNAALRPRRRAAGADRVYARGIILLLLLVTVLLSAKQVIDL